MEESSADAYFSKRSGLTVYIPAKETKMPNNARPKNFIERPLSNENRYRTITKTMPCATGAWASFAKITKATAPMPTPIKPRLVATFARFS